MGRFRRVVASVPFDADAQPVGGCQFRYLQQSYEALLRQNGELRDQLMALRVKHEPDGLPF